ncbi:hypothetical protein UCD39_07180 [Nitrospirillum sp. BR 11752]|uniref:Aa3 type cytochrome c oxidase subunit IV n=1 Tax=Nitrospirillum amazonense TaxID=28077 RepID=A0A560HI56_9PROT|nr:hypothetical protein [Nitrospirillum amazonense]MEE3623773.1 hypothetical protein [Nitrospirillum sp. BR 11752]TWB46142.1 hypothetical protein FBZ90_101477 [Nitrospirillum amazonense]
MAGAHSGAVAVSDTVVKEHADGWHAFTRFVKAGIIAVVLLMLMFLAQFALGWGFSMFLMIVGDIILVLALLLGKV